MATERIFPDQLSNWKRSCYCGEQRDNAVGSELTLFGWVRGRRDHRMSIFVDLRDRSGISQVVFESGKVNATAHKKAKQLRSRKRDRAVRGNLSKRSPETINPDLAHG